MENTFQVSYWKTLKSGFLLIFIATICYRLIDLIVTKKIELAIRSTEGIQPSFWLWVTLSFLISIFFPLLTTLVSIHCLKKQSSEGFLKFFKNFFEYSLLETLRAWGISFLWGLLFIIPGLIKMSFYFLVIFVVTLFPEYSHGQIDALKKSEEISKKVWFKLNLLVLLFFLICPLILSLLFDQYSLIDKNPTLALINVFIETCLIVLYHYWVYKLILKYITSPSPTQQIGEIYVANV